MNRPTFVTAFFDIGRAKKGDGRTIEQYLEWIKKTLQLNCNLYVFTEAKFENFFREHRPKQYPMRLVIIEFKDLYFYKYYDRMKEIIESEEYKSRISHPGRVECLLPEYNIIQYSKFDCLNRTIDENVFNSSSFFWIDAGISRFFLDVDISKPFPGQIHAQFSNNNHGLLIQGRRDLISFPIDGEFIWRGDNLLCGTFFGGGALAIKEIFCGIVGVLENKMLALHNVNNEQLALAILWKENPEWFHVITNESQEHLILFKMMSI